MANDALVATADTTRLAIAREETYGEAPTGTYRNLPFSGESLQLNKGYTADPTMTGNRRSQLDVQTSEDAGGALNVSMRGHVYDDLIEAALWSEGFAQAAFDKKVEGVNIAAGVVTGSLTLSNMSTTFAEDDVIHVEGFTDTGIKGAYRVTDVTSGTVTATSISVGTPATEAAGEAVRVIKTGEHFTGAGITATGGGVTATVTLTGLGSSLAVGDFVRLIGPSNDGNRGVKRITALDTDLVTLTQLSTDPGAPIFVDEASIALSVDLGSTAADGLTCYSHTIERRQTNLDTDSFSRVMTGLVVDEWNGSASVQEILSGSFSFLGSTETIQDAQVGGDYSDVPQREAMNAVRDVLLVESGGTGISLASFAWQVRNNARTRLRIGQLGAFSIADGSFQWTANATGYLEDKVYLERYAAGGINDFAIVIQDPDLVGMALELPRTRLTQAPANAQARGQDVTPQYTFSSAEDVTKGFQGRVVRWI